MHGSFGYELDPAALSDAEKTEIVTQTERFKKYRGLIHNGKYYRLTDPFDSNLSLWEYVSEDKSEILLQGMQFRAVPNFIKNQIKLRGLDENKNYIVASDEKVYSGKALMSGGILLPAASGDFFAYEIFIAEAK